MRGDDPAFWSYVYVRSMGDVFQYWLCYGPLLATDIMSVLCYGPLRGGLCLLIFRGGLCLWALAGRYVYGPFVVIMDHVTDPSAQEEL